MYAYRVSKLVRLRGFRNWRAMGWFEFNEMVVSAFWNSHKSIAIGARFSKRVPEPPFGAITN